jgi:3-phenylpropionate/trans-cinnamate dioxygenase ferredoxin reductase subunit
MTDSIVIVGAGQAGAQTAISARQGGSEGPVVVLGAEPHAPYERPPLSKQFLAGGVGIEQLFMRTPAFYTDKNITIRTNTHVNRIDREAKCVHLASDEIVPYSKLIIATGGRVRELKCPGADLPGVHYLRTVDDVEAFRGKLAKGLKLVIVGGGYIGLEVAAVAIKRGCSVTILEMMPLVLNRVVAPEMSEFYTNVHRAAGVEIRTSTSVTAFEGRERVERVVCGAEKIGTDLVIVGIGIEPNVELAVGAGLDVDNGVVVDECARTADLHIFAAGDCTNHPNSILGGRLRLESVPNALAQGKAAAAAALGKPAPYAEVPWFWSDQYNLKLQMTGMLRPGDRVIIRGSMVERRFSACYLRGGVLVACQSVNAAKDFLQSIKLIAAHATPDPRRLADATIALKDI